MLFVMTATVSSKQVMGHLHVFCVIYTLPRRDVSTSRKTSGFYQVLSNQLDREPHSIHLYAHLTTAVIVSNRGINRSNHTQLLRTQAREHSHKQITNLTLCNLLRLSAPACSSTMSEDNLFLGMTVIKN